MASTSVHNPAPDPEAAETAKYMAELMNQFEGIKLFPVLLPPLTQGEPVEMAQIAETADLQVEEVKRLFKSLPMQELDDSGRLIGFGLTLQETPHRFIIGGRTLHIWCPTNALLFPIGLGQPARLESSWWQKPCSTARMMSTTGGKKTPSPLMKVSGVYTITSGPGSRTRARQISGRTLSGNTSP